MAEHWAPLRPATGIDAGHAAGLRIDLATHAARYSSKDSPGSLRLVRLAADAPAGVLPNVFVTTDEGWTPKPTPGTPPTSGSPGGEAGTPAAPSAARSP